MKTTLLLIGLISVATAAFADDPSTPIPRLPLATDTKSLSLEELARRFVAAKDLPVPEPAKTPFDADPEARKAYLEAYRTGYRHAVAGGYMLSTYCPVAGTPHGNALTAGHYDGEGAAQKDRFAKPPHTDTTK